jgi:aminoglycoside phosphotransferase (APT) family kinase protein
VSDAVATLDLPALERYFAQTLPALAGPLSAEKFGGGQSNPTFLLRSGAKRWVLRRQPPGKLLKSAHAVDREFRVMRALAQTEVPVPPVLHLCQDPAVIGSLFYVMDFVEGRIFWRPALHELAREERGAVFDAMNRALAALHAVDPAAVGLADFGRPGNYFARQLARWSEQYRASETTKRPDMDRLILWLEQNLPPDDGRVAIVHGDYRLDNMIFAEEAPRILAIIDWELSTLGHPFADLAYQCMQWRLPDEGVFRGLGDLDRRAHGLPSEQDYVEAYCRRLGVPAMPHWTFYLAFSFFRMAAILQGVLKRALDGNASNPERGLKMGEAIPVLVRRASELIDARS